ncbi:MAG: UDP-N-acetylmuramate--L-alanine ligase [Candidatus Muirbacterium halophilum]|nr:UDP-N-acetylmuramate--L-alanine ligase [Candidatus Muirbacterium halophilum]
MNIKLSPNKNIHFIGIGGTGMSGIASIVYSMGFPVSGSDSSGNPILNKLSEIGIKIFNLHNGANIPGDTQLVVKSAAIPEENPEIFSAKLRNIPVIKYAKILGYVMDMKKGIAISGTHGKTTTTSLIAYILKNCGGNPGYVIGGVVPQLGGSSAPGENDYFVAEVCEFDRSFHNIKPMYAILNNIEEDHLDYYSGLDEILEAFKEFILQIKPGGILFYSVSSDNIKKILPDYKGRKICYGYDTEADIKGENYYIDDYGKTRFVINILGKEKVQVKMQLFGMHNVINALAAFSVCFYIGIPIEDILAGIEGFTGVKRRFEILYDKNFTLVDDYAHHPTEIRTVLKYSRKKFKNRRIISVFQPHQHSRTRFLLEDFAKSFSDADIIIVPDIYFVRDSEIEKKMISSKDLMKKIVENSGNAFYIPSFDEIEKFLNDNIMDNDLVIFMGAGNINEIGYNIKNRCEV